MRNKTLTFYTFSESKPALGEEVTYDAGSDDECKESKSEPVLLIISDYSDRRIRKDKMYTATYNKFTDVNGAVSYTWDINGTIVIPVKDTDEWAYII